MYKEVIFTLIYLCKKTNANYLVTRNPSRMYDQVLRDITMCRSLIDPACTRCGVSVYRRSFNFSELKSKALNPPTKRESLIDIRCIFI